MLLTHPQKTTLHHFVHLALSQHTAASLSRLIGTPVVLEVGSIALCPLSFLPHTLAPDLTGETAIVHHPFEGGMIGDAVLMLGYPAAVQLTNLFQVHHHQPPLTHLNLSAVEILTELGNIVLTAYLRALDQLLEKPMMLTVPHFAVRPLPDILNDLMLSRPEIRYALLVHTQFCLYGSTVQSPLLLVSGVAGLSCLIRGIELSFAFLT